MAYLRTRPAQAGSIITGSFHPDLEDALLKMLTGDRADDPLSALHVVVPTNLLGIRLSRRLAERTGGHVNVRFPTFRDYAFGLADPGQGDGRALLPTGADEVVLRRLMEEGLAADGYFAGIADRPGLATVLASSIRDLKEACYDVDSLAAAARTAGLLRQGRANKMAELIRIWSAYEGRLEGGGWADGLDVMRAAAETLEESTPPGSRLSPLILYGFYDLNGLQKRIVAAHAAKAGTTVFFPYHDIDSFHFARPTLEWLEGLGLRRVSLSS
ncbi:MAG: hypothetical protein JXB46_09210, partial [Candidatus Eisenbacteria bacterium]|nr:hypothetical protein [Candidatus Eisenbacteria bacterium]